MHKQYGHTFFFFLVCIFQQLQVTGVIYPGMEKKNVIFDICFWFVGFILSIKIVLQRSLY